MTLPKSDPASAQKAAAALLDGKIVIIPTDTVYGFSGLSLKGGALTGSDALIDRMKGSAERKPLIELISSPDEIYRYTDQTIPPAVMQKWPGALTVIVKNNGFYKRLTGRDCTAFRCPGDSWLRGLIALCGAPIYSTSVNKSGMPPLGSVSEIERTFGGDAAVIIDDGDKGSARPSTIVRLFDTAAGKRFEVIRQGDVVVDAR